MIGYGNKRGRTKCCQVVKASENLQKNFEKEKELQR